LHRDMVRPVTSRMPTDTQGLEGVNHGSDAESPTMPRRSPPWNPSMNSPTYYNKKDN